MVHLSPSKLLFSCAIAFGMITTVMAEETKAAVMINSCNPDAFVGAIDSCHSAATVLFLPNSFEETQLSNLNAAVSAMTTYTDSNGINFTASGMSEVDTGNPLLLRNSCELNVDGPGGAVLSFGQILTCAGAFQDELTVSMGGQTMNVGTITTTWELTDILLKTAIADAGQSINMLSGLTFATSGDFEGDLLGVSVNVITLSHDSSLNQCTLTDNGVLTMFPSVAENGQQVCQHLIESMTVEIDVVPNADNRYLYGGAIAAIPTNLLNFGTGQTQGFTATALVENINTARLTGILLDNGQTLESQGFDLTLASGIASPNNATTTPEPNSILGFLLLGMGLVIKKI